MIYGLLVRKQSGFTVTQKDRKAYVLQLHLRLARRCQRPEGRRLGRRGPRHQAFKRKARAAPDAADGASGGKKTKGQDGKA